MQQKINIKKLKTVTLVFMYVIITIQAIMFRALDIVSKPEPLVNYVVTFVVLCMVAVLTNYYLITLSGSTMLNFRFYNILIMLFLYAFSITVSFSFPTKKEYITAQLIARTVMYVLGLLLGMAFCSYFIDYYKANTKAKKKMRLAMVIIYTIFVLVVLTNIKTHLVFYYAPDGNVIYPKTYLIANICPILFFVFHLYETIRSDNDRKTKLVLLSYCFFAMLFIIIDSLPFDNNDIRIDSGIALGALFTIYVIFLQIYVQDKIELSKKSSELREKQTQIMISQIQPHFLYNTLSAIYVLCGDNPKLAQKTIKDFSSYLRQNMSSLNSQGCVMFEKELEHTKIYLSIEKLRFEDLLTVEYDIQYESFMLPPLTLQPIVENAVKYGVRGCEDGGTVRIHTRREDDRIYVVVHDDGRGFDPSVIDNDSENHIGLKNTKQRIESMCGGQLLIESSADEGTTVTIILEEK
ncbi:MAG: histidine kinase [Clostridia bacterium]|nr:histidine kinase [Clostridia bacterium]